VFQLIISSAFNANATFSGVFGMAIAWGVKRGIYSNEAGQGTAPHAAAAAEVNHPLEQGLVQAFSVYIDTILVCTATAFMIIFTNAYNVMGPEGAFIVEYIPGIEEGPAFTQEAINSYFPNNIGGKFVAIALVFFTFTTLMAYYYYAETNLSFLSKRNIPNLLLQAFRIVFLIIVFFGALHEANFAWKLGDIGVGLMAWLNIVALLLLRKKFMEIYKDYRRKFKKIKNT
ncbi:MAG TPA: alanine:cation symporter family protein, partial [Chitinophagaceae bacterium]|nr:alanine:cation symporter family protein [Chitinophagaceae bacterium]